MADGGLEGLATVIKNVKKIERRRRSALFALCQFYHALAVQELQMRQGFGMGAPGEFWINQTSQAVARVFGGAINDSVGVAWFIAHGVDYGVYLELANDRKNEALRPIVNDLLPQFLKDVGRITGGGAKISDVSRG